MGARARSALERVKEAAEQQEAEVGHAADLAEVAAALRQEATAAAPSANLFTPVRWPGALSFYHYFSMWLHLISKR